MKPCQRIEVVIEEPMAPRVIDLLRELGVAGYTAIPNAVGAGERGVRRADELAGDSSNTLFIIACDQPALVETLLERLRPLLSRHGGICLVSESRWLMH